MNGRVYDPVLARFLSPDPVMQDPTNTQDYNKYTYCLNNPLSYTDPSGNMILDANGDPWRPPQPNPTPAPINRLKSGQTKTASVTTDELKLAPVDRHPDDWDSDTETGGSGTVTVWKRGILFSYGNGWDGSGMTPILNTNYLSGQGSFTGQIHVAGPTFKDLTTNINGRIVNNSDLITYYGHDASNLIEYYKYGNIATVTVDPLIYEGLTPGTQPPPTSQGLTPVDNQAIAIISTVTTCVSLIPELLKDIEVTIKPLLADFVGKVTFFPTLIIGSVTFVDNFKLWQSTSWGDNLHFITISTSSVISFNPYGAGASAIYSWADYYGYWNPYYESANVLQQSGYWLYYPQGPSGVAIPLKIFEKEEDY
jgi:hypothetical protein